MLVYTDIPSLVGEETLGVCGLCAVSLWDLGTQGL